jgi:hypothetical protein
MEGLVSCQLFAQPLHLLQAVHRAPHSEFWIRRLPGRVGTASGMLV